MFTGLVADLGRVSAIQRDRDGTALQIATGLADELASGDSIAVDGVCLTAVDVDRDGFRAQAVPETLRRSSLGELRVGAPVNLELSLRAGDRLGGHIVQGHVDGTGVVAGVREEGSSRVLAIQAEPRLVRHLVARGSVAVDGVSLTVSAVTGAGFEVALIPETLARTTLGAIGAGAVVNIEVDVLSKHVQRLLELSA